MSLAERARVALKGEWVPGMRDAGGVRASWADGNPDITDEPTVLALAAVCRRRLDACDAAHGVTTTRRETLAYALRDWAFGALTLADLAERVVCLMEVIE